MGVRTTADELVEKLRDSIKEGIRAAAELAVNEPYGIEEYTELFRAKVSDVLQTLVSLNKDLSR